MRDMDAALVENARVTLEAERQRLLVELSEEVEHPRLSHGAQTAAASEVSESQRGQKMRGREQLHLVAIEAALRRIEAGAFGNCQTCGKPVAPERLEALPWATDCVDCHAKARR
jgi:DnaK suppressor protein